MLGLIYDRMENREQALRAYRDALSLSPENALARFRASTIPISRGACEIAQALLRDPSVPSPRSSRASRRSAGIGSEDTGAGPSTATSMARHAARP